ncbi:MAG: glycerate kinase [Anaerolineaceae bacterium]|nr:glycerate kinase [Anaerolineaceae bacterium]
MTNSHLFLTSTLHNHTQGITVASILSSAIDAVEPGEAVSRFVKLDQNRLVCGDHLYHLDRYEHVYLMAFGKAALPMSFKLVEILGERLTRGWVAPKHVSGDHDPRLIIQPGSHPLPDESSLKAGEMLLSAAGSFTENDLVFCLISGGGSALVTAPYAGVSLADMRELTRQLLACGARIDEINTLRRHLDRIKGGGLAKHIAPAKLVSLILSDVVNSPLEAIASGATAPDPSTLQDVSAIIKKYDLDNKIPASILNHFEQQIETPKPGDKLFASVKNILVGSNELAAQAAARTARDCGFTTIDLRNAWQGEAREVAKTLVEKLLTSDQLPICMIAGGETTVTIQGTGKGGRNQELALAAVPLLADMPHVMLVTLATDGEDGPTDAAGAVVTGETASRAQALGLDPAEYLANNDAYHFFDQLGDLLKPGPTGTNVNDLTFLFRFDT